MNALVKLQQEEYAREGVTCAHIDFPDNEKQIQLIDHKTNGLLSRLDDECSVPKGSDEAYVEKLHKAFKENPLYDTPKRAKGGVLVAPKFELNFPSHGGNLDRLGFVVKHFAGPVMYTAHQWLDKNRGSMNVDMIQMLTATSNALISTMFPLTMADPKKSTVSSVFRKSLRDLSSTMLQVLKRNL